MDVQGLEGKGRNLPSKERAFCGAPRGKTGGGEAGALSLQPESKWLPPPVTVLQLPWTPTAFPPLGRNTDLAGEPLFLDCRNIALLKWARQLSLLLCLQRLRDVVEPDS